MKELQLTDTCPMIYPLVRWLLLSGINNISSVNMNIHMRSMTKASSTAQPYRYMLMFVIEELQIAKCLHSQQCVGPILLTEYTMVW